MPYQHRVRCGFLLSLLLCCQQQAYQLAGRSFYLPRAQGNNSAHALVEFSRYLYPTEQGPWHAHAMAVPGYGQSFRSARIAGYYFNTTELMVAGSQTGVRSDTSFLADYFGLSPAFRSTVYMRPSIHTFVCDFDFYGCYDPVYLRVRLPAAYTRWEFCLREEMMNDGRLTPYPALYMSGDAVGAPYDSFKQALCSSRAYGDVKEGLKFGKLCGPRSASGLADVHIDFGWHAYRNERYYGGLYLRAVVPTGTRPTAEYFFEPVVGNGHHGEIGFGALGRLLLWECEGLRQVSMIGLLNVTHPLASRQCRSFDICRNGFASRYMLLKQFDENNAYTRTLVPAINVTTLPCSVSMHADIEGAVMFGYQDDRFDVNLGYNFWLRTKENICLCADLPGRFGVKGIQNVVDAHGDPSAATQSSATIMGNELSPAEQARTVDTPSPVLLSASDLDLQSAASPRAFTHKLFIYMGHQWECVRRVIPYFGIGAEIEFEGIAPEKFCQSNYNTVAQWGFWFKGGVYL